MPLKLATPPDSSKDAQRLLVALLATLRYIAEHEPSLDELVERYQEAMKLLTDVVNSYETNGCDDCGTIDRYVHNTVVQFIYSEKNNEGG